MTTVFLYLTVLALAVSAISVTVTKSSVAKPMREWIKSRSPFLGKLFSCPYCFSHWVSFIVTAASGVTVIDSWLINFIVMSFAIVALATLCSGAMMRGMLMQEDQIQSLTEDLDEARTMIRELSVNLEEAI